MRRKDREITDFQELINVIENCDVIRLGFSDPAGAYIVPMNFGFEIFEEQIIFYVHSATEGRKIDMIKVCPDVGFELDGKMEVRSSDKACNWSASFESVIGTGHIVLVKKDEEKHHALMCLMKKYGYDGMPDFQPEIMKKVSVLKLKVREISGKRNL